MENTTQYQKDLAKVKQNGLDLQFVKKQTKELCLAAVVQDGRALEFVKKQTPEIIKIALYKTPDPKI
jgi:hypothetical protein